MAAGCRQSADQAESVQEAPPPDAALQQQEVAAGGQAGADPAPSVGRKAVSQWASKLGQKASKIGESAREALAQEIKMFGADMRELKTAVKEVTLEGATRLPGVGGTGGAAGCIAVVGNAEEDPADLDQAAPQNAGAGAGRQAVAQWASKLGQRASKLKETAREVIAQELEKRREEASQSGAGAGAADMPRVDVPLDGQPEPCSAAVAQSAQAAARNPVVQWASKLGQKASKWGESAHEALAHQEVKPESCQTRGGLWTSAEDAARVSAPAAAEPNSGAAARAPDAASAANTRVYVSAPDEPVLAMQEGTSGPEPLAQPRAPPATASPAAPASSPERSDTHPAAVAEALRACSVAAEGLDGLGGTSQGAHSGGQAAATAATEEEVHVEDILDFSPDAAVVDAIADAAPPHFPAPPAKVPATTTAPAVTDKSFDDLWDSILED